MASWKKIIVSGSNAELNHITSSGNLEVAGNISGSSTSTGSLQKLILSETSKTALAIGHQGTDSDQNTVDIRSNDSSTSLRLVSNNDVNDYYDAIFRANYNDLNSVELEGPAGRVFLEYRHTGRKTLIGNTAGDTELVSTKLSGSAASTGSFGHVMVGGNNFITAVSESAAASGFGSGGGTITALNNQTANRLVTIGSTTTELDGEANLTFDGTELRVQGDIVAENFIVSSSVTYMTQSFSSGSTIFGNTLDDTHQFTGSLLVTGSATITGSLNVRDDITSTTGHISLNQGKIFTDGGAEPKFEMETNAGSAVRFHTSEGSYISVGANASAFGVGHTSTGAHKLRVDGRGTLRPFGIANNASVIFDVDTAGNVTGSGNLEIAGNISGSATSTGSFGSLTLGNTTAKTILNIKSREQNSLTNGIEFIAADSSNVLFRVFENNTDEEGELQLFKGSDEKVRFRADGESFLKGGRLLIEESTLSQTPRAGADELVIAGASSDGVGMSIRGHEDYYKSLVFGGTTSDRDAVVSYSSTSQNKMTIGTTRASGIINFVTGNGDVSFTLSGGASGVISGSATSTGSFGSLILADKIQGDVTVGGNLIVEGDTIQQQVANLNIEDRFILLNSGSASGDGGLIVQTESHTAGVVYGYDDDESRWGFQQGTKLSATGSAIAPDAYASAVVTSDDSNYQKNGNIRVEGGEIYIYVE